MNRSYWGVSSLICTRDSFFQHYKVIPHWNHFPQPTSHMCNIRITLDELFLILKLISGMYLRNPKFSERQWKFKINEIFCFQEIVLIM